MKILIASDHAGFSLKEALVPFLEEELGYEVEDMGPYDYDENDDYPDLIAPLAKKISEDSDLRGIIIGGSGQGEAIVANRFPNVRTVVFNGQYNPGDGREIPNEIVISREHNDSNILSLGARFINEEEAFDAVKLWLETPFPFEERHMRRIKKIDKLEN
jgi:ribose 5-phosphate isomerase B